MVVIAFANDAQQWQGLKLLHLFLCSGYQALQVLKQRWVVLTEQACAGQADAQQVVLQIIQYSDVVQRLSVVFQRASIGVKGQVV